MAIDPVNHKALKGKFAQRKDKDINNDGKTDSTDKYLHTRRKAISKNVKNKGETATMNPKLNDKTTSENKTTNESRIRKSLKSVLETKQAKHGPSDETRDTFEKQLSTRKGEKDFVDAHKTSEVPVDGNVAAKQTADAIANSVKAAPGRTNDQKTGDKNIIPSPTTVLNKIKEAYASMFK